MPEHRTVRRFAPHHLLPLGAAVLIALSLAACGEKKEAGGAGAPGSAAPPPPEVGVITAQPESVGLTTELSFGTDLFRNPRNFGRKRVQLIDHDVDRVFKFQDLALGVDRDLL